MPPNPSPSRKPLTDKKLAAVLCSKIVNRWKFHVGQKSGVPCHLAVLDACQLFKLPCPPWIAVEAGNRVTGARNQKPKRRNADAPR